MFLIAGGNFGLDWCRLGRVGLLAVRERDFESEQGSSIYSPFLATNMLLGGRSVYEYVSNSIQHSNYPHEKDGYRRSNS